MYSKTDITAKAWLVVETVNLMISPRRVSKIFLIGSYAAGNQDEWSDLDYLVELSQNLGQLLNFYPDASVMFEVNDKFKEDNIHVIFGTEEAQKALKKPYREIQGGVNGNTHSANI